MKRLVIYVWVCFVALFAVWYVPASFVNVLACDDFWLGNAVIRKGFWNAQIHFYRTWEGSYYHSFLATIPHVFNMRCMPFLTNMLVLTIFVAAIWFFIRTYYSFSHMRSALFSIILAAFYYVTTSGGAEIRFWVCANASYVSGISTLLIFLSLYHRWRYGTMINLLFPWVCMFLICGHKVTYIVCLFVSMMTHDIVFKAFSRKKIILFYFPLVLFSLANVIAPGNYLRLNENIDSGRSSSIIAVIIFRFREVAPMFLWAFALPPLTIGEDSSRRVVRSVGAVILGAMVFFLFESFLMYFCFGDPGPRRTYVLSEIWFLICGVIVRDKIISWWNIGGKEIQIYWVVVGIGLCASQLNLICQVPPTISYANKAHERNLAMQSEKITSVIKIPELPPSYLLLSYYANDVVWLKKVYAPYFRKCDCDIELVK